jgi:hypothetical protein
MIMTKSKVLLAAITVLVIFQIFFWRERIRTYACHFGIRNAEIIEVPETETGDHGETNFDQEMIP